MTSTTTPVVEPATGSGALRAARRGLGVLALASAVAGGLNYGYVVLMGLLLPAGQFVTVAAAQGLLLVVGSAAASTIPWLTAQQLVRSGDSPARRAATARASLISAASLAAVAAAGTALVSGFAEPGERVAIAVSAALICLGQVGVGWVQGSSRFRLLAALVVGEVVLKVATGTVAAVTGLGASGVVWSAAVGAALLVVVSAVLVVSDTRGRSTRHSVDAGWWRAAAGVGALRSAVSALMVADVVLVALVLPATRSVADYQLAMSIGRAPVFLATAVGQAYLAVLTTRPMSGPLREETWRRLVSLALPAAAVLATVPAPVVARVLPGGDDLATFLPLAASTGLAMALIHLVASWGQAASRVGALTAALAAACVAQCCLVLAGVGLGGVLGAAVATSVGAALVVVVMVVLTSRGLGLRLYPSAAPAVAGVALLLSRPVPALWLAVAVGVAALVLREVLRSPTSELEAPHG